MTKISKKSAYPVKNPVVGDFFVGTDSENNNKTVSFGFEYAANLINRINGSLIINYMFKTDVNIPLAVLTEGHFLSQDNNTDINTVTKLYVNKTNFQEDDLSDLFLFIKENTGDYYFKLQNSENLINAVYFKINSIVAYSEYFEFNIAIDKTNPSLTTLVDSNVYFFSFEIKSNITKTSDLENDGEDGSSPFVTESDISGKENKAEKGQANGYAPLNALVKIASTYLNIVNDLITGGATSLLSAEQGKQLQLQVDAITDILFSDDVNFDTIQEIVDALKDVQDYIDTILVNDLTTGGVTKALTAEMGKTLKGLIDALTAIVSTLQSDVTSIDTRLTVLENTTPPLPEEGTKLTGNAKVIWTGTGYEYDIVYDAYYINNILYPAGVTRVTLSASDATYDRIDVFALGTTGGIVLEGTPSADPQAKSIDTTTQIYITFQLVTATSTAPVGTSATNEIIYDENSEWTISTSGVTVDANYASNPFKGSKSLRAAAFNKNQSIYFTKGSLLDISDYTELGLRIRLNTSWAMGNNIQFAFYNGSTKVSSTVTVSSGNHSFQRDVLNTYQFIIIQMNEFDFNSSGFNKLQITRDNGTAEDMQFDDIRLTASGTGVSSKQKAIVSIVTNSGVVNATAEDDTIEIKGTGGAQTSASGKVVTIDVSDAVQEAKDYADAGLDLKVDKVIGKGLSSEDYTTTEKTKVSYITITQAVNLDDIETRVNDLDAAVVLKGTWSAAGGAFPGSGVAQAGWSYLVTADGTVDGIEFKDGDRIICVTDNASTSTYAGNWYKADYTDRVNTVAGRTGNVVITSSDLSDFNSAVNALIAAAISGKEDSSNKSTSTAEYASSSKFPVWSAIVSFFDAAKIRSILGITTLSGSNTGDQDLSALAPLASPALTGTPTAPTPSVGDNSTKIATTAFVLANTKQEVLSYACSDEASNLTVGTLITFRMPFAMTLTSVRASVNTAPTVSTIIVDVKESGVSIFSTLLSIDATEKTSTTAASAAVISDANLADDAEITISTTQIGSGTAGAGLKVTLIGTRV